MSCTVSIKNLLLLVYFSLFASGVITNSSNAQTVDPCAEVSKKDIPKYMQDAYALYGGAPFANPKTVMPTSEATPYVLSVQYGFNVVAGCKVYLRSYNGNAVGDTIKAKPGDTLFLTVINNLPGDRHDDHPQKPAPPDHAAHFSFNITNLHTHGLHVDPVGTSETPPLFASDNVLLEIKPGTSQNYRIHIDADHPSGLFWYHAHVHGTTAMQVSSGMAGALIIEGGDSDNGNLDAIPSVAAAAENIFVLQQTRFGSDGKLETLAKIESSKFRPVLVNGQFVPTIKMQPGEVQRWRFIHAGVKDNIHLAVEGHELVELAVDGISLGRAVAWPKSEDITGDSGLVLGPGYRSDVLIKASELKEGETERVVFLMDMPLSARNSIAAATEVLALRQSGGKLTTALTEEIGDKPGQVIARIVIAGENKMMDMPSAAELASAVPVALPPPTETEMALPATQEVTFSFGFNRLCDSTGFCDPKSSCTPGEPNCYTGLHLINDHIFMPTNVRTLKLGSTEKWRLSGFDNTHPFHIHVNPFWVSRSEPDGAGGVTTNSLWKDTLLLSSDGTPVEVISRYTKYQGAFVLHCHILNHEDRGMMQMVEIAN